MLLSFLGPKGKRELIIDYLFPFCYFRDSEQEKGVLLMFEDITEKNEQQILEDRSYKIVKANDLVQKARYDLNLSELKLLAFCMSKIKPNDSIDNIYQFTVKEYCQVLGLDYKNGWNYVSIKKNLKGLRDKSFWMITKDGEETTVGWLQNVTLKRNSGVIKVQFDKRLQEYILELHNNYFQYELLYTLPMTSNYSFRMYELLQSYEHKGSFTIDLEELKGLLCATHYTRYKDFRVNVIEISQREINKYTDIRFIVTPIKEGKKVTKLYFEIEKLRGFERMLAGATANEAIDGQMTIEEYLKGADEE